MAATVRYFMFPEDELALFRAIARHELTVYPEIVPPGWRAPRADEHVVPALDLEAYYLAAEQLGPVVVHPVKRGPNKGMLEIEEIPSPVLHYERSLRNDAGELVGGRIWAELDVTDDPQLRYKSGRLRAVFNEVETLFRKSFRRSDPKGFWVGPTAARAWKSEGLVLREPGHKGSTFGVWR